MDEVIFLEVLEGDSVHARHRLERFPVTVGRGYTNDVIVDDPKVSALHLRIERAEDGALVLRDVGSTNGTYLVEPWTRLAQMVLTPDARVAVGDTVLRFRGQSHPVERTFVGEAPDAPRRRYFEEPLVFPVALAALVLRTVLDEHLSNYLKPDWSALSIALAASLAFPFVWACAWALASRIARRQYHFRAHAAIGTLSLLGITFIPMLLTLLTFSLSLGPGVRWLELATSMGVLAWGLYWHLRYVIRVSARQLQVAVACVGVFLGLLFQADTLLGNEEFSARLPFQRTLLPPALRLAPAQPVEAFFENPEDLQQEVDALAKEE
jgi:hypothetical protein